jgi:hypothetical protein
MTAIATPATYAATRPEPTVAVRRRTIDTVLTAGGALVAVVLFAAGALLTWGASFSEDYVKDELTAQKIAFPPAAALEEEGRTDLLKYAEANVDTGPEAEAYATYIDGHLANIADGMTYAELGTVERAATAAVEEATVSGASADEVAALQGEADAISGQRNTLFKGETLRGLLLSAFAWSTVGSIAGIAAWFAFAAAGLMVVLVVLGIRHHHKVVASER